MAKKNIDDEQMIRENSDSALLEETSGEEILLEESTDSEEMLEESADDMLLEEKDSSESLLEEARENAEEAKRKADAERLRREREDFERTKRAEEERLRREKEEFERTKRAKEERLRKEREKIERRRENTSESISQSQEFWSNFLELIGVSLGVVFVAFISNCLSTVFSDGSHGLFFYGCLFAGSLFILQIYGVLSEGKDRFLLVGEVGFLLVPTIYSFLSGSDIWLAWIGLLVFIIMVGSFTLAELEDDFWGVLFFSFSAVIIGLLSSWICGLLGAGTHGLPFYWCMLLVALILGTGLGSLVFDPADKKKFFFVFVFLLLVAGISIILAIRNNNTEKNTYTYSYTMINDTFKVEKRLKVEISERGDTVSTPAGQALYEFVDGSYRRRTEYQYDSIGYFAPSMKDEPMFIVRQNGKYGLVDKKGKELVEPKYDKIGNADNEEVTFKGERMFKAYVNNEIHWYTYEPQYVGTEQ